MRKEMGFVLAAVVCIGLTVPASAQTAFQKVGTLAGPYKFRTDEQRRRHGGECLRDRQGNAGRA
jgi:hypothetical protein